MKCKICQCCDMVGDGDGNTVCAGHYEGQCHSVTDRNRDEGTEIVTLEEAKEWLRKRWEKGASCPCCDQYVKLYKRKLNSGMARTLLVIYRAFSSQSGLDWLDVTEHLRKRSIIAANSNTALLRHWGLLEQKKDEEREDGSPRVGLYRITDLGIRFAEGKANVNRYVYMYNNQVIERRDSDDSETTIHEALGDKFSYDELMAATPEVRR